VNNRKITKHSKPPGKKTRKSRVTGKIDFASIGTQEDVGEVSGFDAISRIHRARTFRDDGPSGPVLYAAADVSYGYDGGGGGREEHRVGSDRGGVPLRASRRIPFADAYARTLNTYVRGACRSKTNKNILVGTYVPPSRTCVRGAHPFFSSRKGRPH